MCTPITSAELTAATASFSTLLGRGATGAVYAGAHHGTPIAVKLLAPPAADAPPALHAAHLRRFRAELHALSSYAHPRLVRLLHACEQPLALVLELLPGGSLADHLRAPDGAAAPRGALTPLQRVDAALGVARGLQYLHGLREPGEGGAQAPVVHRDVKSANVGFATLGGGGGGGGGADGELFAKLIDCGLAKALRGDAAAAPGASFSAGVLGTPGYMAPELADGVYTVPSEVYSFGVILLELLTGQRVGLTTASAAREGAEDAGAAHVAALAEACWPPPAAAALAALAVDCTLARPARRPQTLAPVAARLAALRALLAPGAPTADCPVCLESAPRDGGVHCSAPPGAPSHFCCRACLQAHTAASVRGDALARNAGRVPCVAPGCGARPWALEELAPHLDAGALLAYAAAMRYAAIDLPALLAARAEAARARAAEVAAIADAAERVRALRLLAVEEDLTLHCPRCAGAFVDFTGCAALVCRDAEGGGRRGCGAGFCALCLADCGGDAHAHVLAAHAPPALRAANDPRAYYFTEADYAAAHRGLRLRALAARLRGLAGEAGVQEALLAALAGADLGGVGLSEGEVRAAAGMREGGAAAAQQAGRWACRACTLENDAGAGRCGACDGERGGGGEPPAAELFRPGMSPFRVLEVMLLAGEDDEGVAYEGLRALRCLTMGHDYDKDGCMKAGAANTIVRVLRAHPLHVKVVHEGCWALANLTSRGRAASQDACMAAGAAQVAVAALREHRRSGHLVSAVCWMLGNLAESSPSHRAALVACGAVDALAGLLRFCGDGFRYAAGGKPSETLRKLGYSEAGVALAEKP